MNRLTTDRSLDLSNRYSDIPDQVLIQRYAEFFGDVFMFGAMECEVKIVRGVEKRNKHHRNDAYTEIVKYVTKSTGVWPFKKREMANRCKITLYAARPRTSSSSINRLQKYLSTLLLEMITGFFLLFACDNVSCIGTWEKLGRKGFACAWQDVAFALEKACDDERFLNLRLRREMKIKRMDRLVREVVHGGWSVKRWVVEDRWGLSFDEMVEICERMKREREARDRNRKVGKEKDKERTSRKAKRKIIGKAIGDVLETLLKE